MPQFVSELSQSTAACWPLRVYGRLAVVVAPGSLVTTGGCGISPLPLMQASSPWLRGPRGTLYHAAELRVSGAGISAESSNLPRIPRGVRGYLIRVDLVFQQAPKPAPPGGRELGDLE
jgi:hypothetical protein